MDRATLTHGEPSHAGELFESVVLYNSRKGKEKVSVNGIDIFLLKKVSVNGGAGCGMARKLRVEYPGAIYHLMNRGDRRESIFKDDEDRKSVV